MYLIMLSAQLPSFYDDVPPKQHILNVLAVSKIFPMILDTLS